MSNETNSRFEQMKRYFFDHATTENFIEFLMSRGTVIAPQRKGQNSFIFDEVRRVADIVFDYPRTIQPLKKYFLPPREVLLEYCRETNTFRESVIPDQPRIFFGVHAYDMQAIKRLDVSFSRRNPEWNYLKRRENVLFIGISFTPDEWHFSKGVGIEIEKVDGFCLYFEPVENGFLVFEVDQTGRDLLSDFGAGFSVDAPVNPEIQEKSFPAKIKYHFNRLPKIFEQAYNSPVWEHVAERCVGCGTCNLLCPTCYCFDVTDEVSIDLSEGKRERFWDSCMVNPFAEVAGGENFRDKISSRTRHRLFRKFKYNTEVSGELYCVGCGRCSKYCPAGINLVDLINELIDDVTAKQQRQTA
jgi:sulfhydrogenase subunit beta (sulfur reductase)